jgi:hypothetical protein
VADNALLRQWWESELEAEDVDQLARVFTRIRAYGDHLGEEIVLSVPLRDGNLDVPLFLARAHDAPALAGLLREDLAALLAESPDAALTLIEGALPAAPAAGEHLFFWLDGGLLAVSPAFDALRGLDAVRQRQLGSLAGSTFHAQLAERYAAGVEWLVGLDLESILAVQHDTTLAELGLPGSPSRHRSGRSITSAPTRTSPRRS